MPRDGKEIAVSMKATRRKRAKRHVVTNDLLPTSAADPEQKLRRKRAMKTMLTESSMPVSAPIGSGDASGDTGTIGCVNAKGKLSQVANFGAEAGKWLSISNESMPLAPILSGGQKCHDNQIQFAASKTEANGMVKTIKAVPPSSISPSGGHVQFDDRTSVAASETGAIAGVTTKTPMPPSPIILALIELQRQRVFCIKSQSRCDRSCEAFIARYIGYSSPREKIDDKDAAKARKEIFARAAAMRRAVEKGGQEIGDNHQIAAPSAGRESQKYVDNQRSDAPSACIPIIINSAASRLAWDNLRNQVESEMRKLAKSLPVHLWTENIKGFGELGLAVVVGEAGDLSNYSTKERLWKRLGLAVIDGERQQMRTNPEQAAAHGYYPRRRSEIWNIADSMFKNQWSGAKEGREAGPTGPYGEVYQRRKTHTATREGWSLKRRDDDARRIMSKALVEDLWRVWNRLSKRRNYQPEHDGDGPDV